MAGGKEGVGNLAGSFRKIFAHGWEHDAFIKFVHRRRTLSPSVYPSLSADPRVYMCARVAYRI